MKYQWAGEAGRVRSEQKQLSRESPVSLPSQDHLDKAIELKPQDPLSYYMLGRWCYAVGDLCTTHTRLSVWACFTEAETSS